MLLNNLGQPHLESNSCRNIFYRPLPITTLSSWNRHEVRCVQDFDGIVSVEKFFVCDVNLGGMVLDFLSEPLMILNMTLGAQKEIKICFFAEILQWEKCIIFKQYSV